MGQSHHVTLGENNNEIMFSTEHEVWRVCLPETGCDATARSTKMLFAGGYFYGVGVLHEKVSANGTKKEVDLDVSGF